MVGIREVDTRALVRHIRREGAMMGGVSTQTLDPEELVPLLNEYLDLVNAMADKHGGIADKFMGDGVLIFFDDTRHRGTSGEARACIRMAIEMREELALLRDVWRNEEQGSICTCAWASIQASAGSETSARRRTWTTP